MRNLMDLLENVPLQEQWRRIIIGLHAPKDSGERRYAVNTLQHLFGPSGMSIVGSLLIALIALNISIDMKGNKNVLPDLPSISIDPWKEFKIDPLPERPQREDKPDLQPKDPMVDAPWSIGSGLGDRTMDPSDPLSDNSRPAGTEDGIKDNELIKNVESIPPLTGKSILTIKNLYGRTDEERIKALNKYGTSDGGGGAYSRGTDSEGAVIKALRWLKKEQLPDGSWKNTRPAMTGLALLTYLAHGDTTSSKEFGITVEKGIKWLLENQESDGRFKGRDAHDYSHPIATYALCEAYGMTKLPFIKSAAERAIDVIIKGQHPGGGWDYNCRQSDRDDTSYMGWCIQALKAARIAQLENEGLKQALEKAITGIKKNADATGKFGYTSSKDGNGGLTGVGVLCMQMLGAGGELETRKGILWLQQATFDWNRPWLTSPIYYWYYITQAKFQAGGEIWNNWNRQFAEQLIRNQKIETKAIKGPTGMIHDIGWWEPPADIKGHSDGPVMDTTLCTLQLEVYYRYLPTFQVLNEKTSEHIKPDPGDLKVEVRSINQKN